MTSPDSPEPPTGRRGRRRPRTPAARGPSEVLTVFFLAGIAMLVAGAAIVHVATGVGSLRWLALHLV